MKWFFRKSRRLGPVRITATERGLSWGLRTKRWTWNPRTGRHTYNTPGPGSIRWGGGRRR